MDIQVNEVIGKLRGYFNTKIYIGGSYATHKIAFPLLEYNDVDVFILAKREIEDWAMQNLLHTIFDTVEANVNGTADYKIAHQYKRYKCTYQGLQFDLIFMDTDFKGLIESTASDLSSLYLKVNYSEYMISPCTDSNTKEALANLLLRRKCTIYKERATEEHIQKIIKRCNALGLDYYPKTVEPMLQPMVSIIAKDTDFAW